MPIRRPQSPESLEQQALQLERIGRGASALGGVGMAATLSGPHYAVAMADPDLVPRVAAQWPTWEGAKEQTRLEAVGSGQPDFSALDVAKTYGMSGLGAFGAGLERSVSDLPGGPAVQENMDLAWQQAEKAGVPGALQMGADLLAPGMHELAMIPAFHGTPHIFDAFNFKHIGTGEGAQAFGHGLYFAENPRIARSYARDLARESGLITVDGKLFDAEIPSHAAAQQADWHQRYHQRATKGKGEPLTNDQLMERMKRDRGELRENVSDLEEDLHFGRGDRDTVFEELEERSKELDELDNAILHIGGGGEVGKMGIPEGHVYSVELDFDHEDLLDWDVMLDDMPPDVQRRIEKAFDDPIIGDVRPEQLSQYLPKPTDSGQAIYRKLTSAARTQSNASAALARAGVPGLRYHDTTSRGTKGGRTGLIQADGKKYHTQGQTEIDVRAGAANIGSLEKFVESTTATLNRFRGTDISFGMPVSSQAIGELEARINVAQRLLDQGIKVGPEPLTRNIVAFSDEGIEIMSRQLERKMKGPSY